MTLLKRYPAALVNTFGPPKLALVRGRGARVWDEDGKEYLDLLAGIAVNSLGHAHPAVVSAVTEQLSTLGHVSNFFTTEPQVALAERLLGLSGRSGRVFFSNSGTEANEAALKMTRRTGRTHLIAMEGSFHGRTMGSLALTAKEAYRTPFEPLPGEVTFVRFGDLSALESAITDQTAAVVLEPVQGEAGVNLPPVGYLAAVRELTRRRGVLLWLDEVQTGIGRTGDWFASDIPADLVTLAKGLGGGIPIGATLAFEGAATLLQPGNHGTTFGGNPVACAAALAVLDTIESTGLLDQVKSISELFVDSLVHPQVTEVRAAGLLIGITLTDPIASRCVEVAQDEGFIINACSPDRIRLAPPLIISKSEAESFLAAWPRILQTALETQKVDA
ncbi:MAG TPA: acetylornithine transaminase [Marmoricola sp.]|nr:acetylornithine transaminase [Marmoricola sp.]HNJ78365.1 acetylornithine transaminase [Marmoricola sp.]HNN47466.1 acetylornithine transaminase [Marmoricola sp.]